MIKVTEDYVIQVDDLNYTVCENKPYTSIDKKSGRDSTRYPIVGYCSSLENALSLVRGRLIRDALKNGDRSLSEAIETVQKITADFQQIIADAMKGEPKE
jgi:hypothetical protein